jgi:hypothetical protein
MGVRVPRASRTVGWLFYAGAIACLAAAGCHSKGNLAGKLKVEASPELTAQGLSVKDWAASGSNFSVKLEATRDLEPNWLLTLQADGGEMFQTMTPLKMKAGQTEWIEIAGPKFLEKFEVTSETKTVTVGLRNRLTGR